jgi:hypothetical protein
VLIAQEIGTSFVLGCYTVRICLRRDNPAFPIFVIYRGEIFIGRHMSRPGLSDCERLERPAVASTGRKGRWLSENRQVWNALKRKKITA